MGFLGFGPPEHSHEESSTSHWNVLGSTVQHTITEADGTRYDGYGRDADEAAAKAYNQHDRDR